METNATLERAVVVNITVESSTASASDFSLLNTSLTFTAGEVNKVTKLTIKDDDVLESEEVIQVNLQSTDDAVEVDGINPINISILDTSGECLNMHTSHTSPLFLLLSCIFFHGTVSKC